MNRPDVFRSHFESLNGSAPTWVRRLRATGMQRFADLGFPTTRLEDWKYTDVSRIAETPFRMPVNASNDDADRVARLAGDGAARLVFVNGRYSERLSTTGSLPKGAHVLPLSRAFEGQGLETHLASLADLQSESFTALNTAFLEDGAYVHIEKGAIVEAPIQLLFMSSASTDPVASHPRVLIVAEHGSEAAVIEDYVGEGTYFTNAVTEIALGENAKIDHYRLQRESAEGFHVGSVDARQERDSRLRSYSISLGGALARIAVNTRLEAEGGECLLDGLYMAHGRQHVDHHTSIDHRRPRCSSRELYKGVLADRSRGVFRGRVLVRPGAQHTDARQSNPNLLLSDGAEIDGKPQLEIHADDVKCSHGSAIGRVDENALFYLRARGIDEPAARALLVRGFAAEVLAALPEPALAEALGDAFAELLGGPS